MEELLDQLKAACAGLTADEIESQLQASQYADQLGDLGLVARFLAALGQVGDPMAEAPDQEETPEESGND